MRKSSAAFCIFKISGHYIILGALFCFFCALTGCAAIRPAPGVTTAGPPLKDPHAFLQKIVEENKKLQQLSALSRLKIASPRGSLSVKGAVIARFPACLRVEMFAFLNQLAFLLVTDGATMSFFLPSQNTFYTGKAADEHLSFLYGADIRLQDAITLFLGYPRILPYDAAHLTWRYDTGRYLLVLPTEGGLSQQVWIDPAFNKIVKYALFNAAGKAQYMFSFADFKEAGSYRLPGSINLTFYPSQTHVIITYSDPDTAITPETGLFTVTTPNHARISPLRDLSQSFFLPAE
jgi:hypothetical protein